MKLYYAKDTCSLAVRIIINALEIKCEFEGVNLKTHQTWDGQDYYAINPKGSVPALVLDEGQLLTENTVIQQYLADAFDQNHQLLPGSGIERYRVLEWLNFISTELHKSCSPLFNPTVPEELKTKIFRPALIKKLSHVNQSLSITNPYLMGSKFSLADAYLYVVLRWQARLGIDLHTLPQLEKYFSTLKHYPPIAQSLQQEGL